MYYYSVDPVGDHKVINVDSLISVFLVCSELITVVVDCFGVRQKLY